MSQNIKLDTEMTKIEHENIGKDPTIAARKRLQKTFDEPTLEFFNMLVGQNTHSLLGRTGIKLTRICLGTMNFGEIDKNLGNRPGQLEEDEAHKILDRFVELGGNCIDTANFFPWFGSTAGRSEEIIGNWLKKSKFDREKLFIITKLRLPSNDYSNVNAVGLSRNNIFNSVNHSLKRLQSEYIDLLLIDGWDTSVSTFDLVRHMDDLVKSDKIRYYGGCDLKAWQIQKLIDYSKLLGTHKPKCYEGEYNLLTRGCELEVADVCLHERIGFLAYSPLKYGFITEKELQSEEKNARIKAESSEKPLAAMSVPSEEIQENPKYYRVYNCCLKIAKKKNLTQSQIALLWTLQQTFVTCVIVGVQNTKELEENMACINNDIRLTDDEMLELNEAAYYDFEYPYNNLASFVGRKIIRPTSDAIFEQLTLMHSNLESYLNIKSSDKEVVPSMTKESEIIRPPGIDYVPEHERERNVPHKEQPDESKQKESKLEGTIQKEEIKTTQRTF